jgi:hypothetical protein
MPRSITLKIYLLFIFNSFLYKNIIKRLIMYIYSIINLYVYIHIVEWFVTSLASTHSKFSYNTFEFLIFKNFINKLKTCINLIHISKYIYLLVFFDCHNLINYFVEL